VNRNTWDKFKKIKEQFRTAAEDLTSSLPGLKDIQQQFANSRSAGNGVYMVETPVVYNTALDDVTIKDDIKLILVADNPGRREQAAENRRYLVGPSGKIAQKFFFNNPSLGIDFRKNVIILNKTPIHSPRTTELRELCKMGTIKPALEKSQKIMTEILLKFHEALDCPVWITGYSEMRKGGIFQVYTENLKELYAEHDDLYKKLFFFRHFSMNQFTIDLKQQSLPEENVLKSLKRIGTAYKKRILE